MIIGLGSDLCNIRRIEDTLEKFGPRFKNRVFTEREQRESDWRKKASKRENAASYAKRFAAKEACAKALGTGFRMGVFWRDLQVWHMATGQPHMTLTGGAEKRLQSLMPANHIPCVHVTMTDDFPWAQAMVVIEAVRE